MKTRLVALVLGAAAGLLVTACSSRAPEASAPLDASLPPDDAAPAAPTTSARPPQAQPPDNRMSASPL